MSDLTCIYSCFTKTPAFLEFKYIHVLEHWVCAVYWALSNSKQQMTNNQY